MTERRPRILVLGLGNDILGDDAVGLLAARRLRRLLPESVEVIEAGGAGLDLLDLLEGYDRALLLDSILTGKYPAGTVLEFTEADFKKDDASSPHYAGLPPVFPLASCLDIAFPSQIRIDAMEIENAYEVSEGLSLIVESNLPALIDRGRFHVLGWLSIEDRTGDKPA